MSRMLGTAELWWMGRTVRERRMLIFMAALIVATAAWMAVVRPVLAWRMDASDRAASAAVDLAEVRAAAALIEPRKPGARRAPTDLEPLVRRTAEAVGVTVVTTMSPSGDLGFQVSGVASAPLFGWLSALETDHQVAICSLGVIENVDATLNAEGALSLTNCSG